MLRASCIFVADGGKSEQKAEDLLEVEPLVCRGQVMWLRPVWASRLGEALAKTEDLSKPEWCFVRWLQFSRNLEELAHGVRPGHADILILEHEEIAIPRPGLCLSFFRNKSRIAFLQQRASINYVRKVDVISAT